MSVHLAHAHNFSNTPPFLRLTATCQEVCQLLFSTNNNLLFNLSFVKFCLAYSHNFSNNSSWSFYAATCQAVCLKEFCTNNSSTKVSACSVSSRLSNKNPVILALPSRTVVCNVNRHLCTFYRRVVSVVTSVKYNDLH